MAAEPDFSGYATKANLKCSDGRTISVDAFKHQDGMTVPLVWQHAQNEPANVLGHAILENREDGVYCRAFFNESEKGKSSKLLVQHGDIKSLSIYANNLVEKAKNVMHGMIREVSLVLAGANPGARIDFVNIAHADGSVDELDDEAVIFTGLEIEHGAIEEEEAVTDAENNDDLTHEDGETVKDVFDTLSEKQKNVVFYMLGEALKGDSAKHSATDADPEIAEVMHSLNEKQTNVVMFMLGEALEHSATENGDEIVATDDGDSADADTAAHADNQEGNQMTNVFDQTASGDAALQHKHELTAEAKAKIFKDAKRSGSLKHAVEMYAEDNVPEYTLQHGIQDIDVLFPDAKLATSGPEYLKRRTEWVARVLDGTRHTPFSRIKSLTANLTLDEARAKGYVKGNLKAEEFFRVSKRVTTPQTIYKKQKLDRDDILDITDFDVVAWLKSEMRLMLDEELARAILIGDGRSNGDNDKIKEENVRPIATDDNLFVTRVNVNLGDANSSAEELVTALIRNRRHYRGSGTPVLFTSEAMLSELLLVKDNYGRRMYDDVAALKVVLRVSDIIPVEAMDAADSPCIAIMVNLQDYTIGTDRGGEVTLFDDFDLDYNQNKYLLETRMSGALTKVKSALVVFKTAGTDVNIAGNPQAPAWNNGTKQVTVPTVANVTYKNKSTGATLTTGSPVTLAAGQTLTVIAVPNTGYYFDDNADDEFYFTYEKGQSGPAF